jgi:hypothetical protein
MLHGIDQKHGVEDCIIIAPFKGFPAFALNRGVRMAMGFSDEFRGPANPDGSKE